MDEQRLPLPLQQLSASLEPLGFEVIEDKLDHASFGDRVVVLRERRICVRFVRDRAQWFVEISGPQCEDWFSPMVWRACLEGHVHDLSTPSLDEQCSYVTNSIRDILAVAANDIALLSHLRETRTQRAKMRRSEPNTH